jgi:hypothetical protein
LEQRGREDSVRFSGRRICESNRGRGGREGESYRTTILYRKREERERTDKRKRPRPPPRETHAAQTYQTSRPGCRSDKEKRYGARFYDRNPYAKRRLDTTTPPPRPTPPARPTSASTASVLLLLVAGFGLGRVVDEEGIERERIGEDVVADVVA